MCMNDEQQIIQMFMAVSRIRCDPFHVSRLVGSEKSLFLADVSVVDHLPGRMVNDRNVGKKKVSFQSQPVYLRGSDHSEYRLRP